MHRTRRRTVTALSAAVLTLLTVTTLAAVDRRAATAATAAARAATVTATAEEAGASGPDFPRPGGGPQAIHGFSDALFWFDEPQSYLLDPRTGRYRRLPYPTTVLSPDGTKVAVETADGRIGVASRQALLRAGARAVRLTDLPAGSPAWWSPDGAALLVTTIEKGDGPPGTFTAHRYDVASGRIRHTPIAGLECEICIAGWAADSTRYVVMLRGAGPGAPSGPIQYLHPDGTPGSMVGAEGVIRTADAYSPSRRYVIVEPVRPVPDPPPPTIVDLRTGVVVAAVETAWPLVGWYDDDQVVRISPEHPPTVLEVVDIHTGEVTTQVPAPGLPPYLIQLGSSAGLRGNAARLGF